MGLKQLLLGKFNIWFDHSPIEKNAQGRKDGTDKNQVEAQIVEHLQEFMFIKLTFNKIHVSAELHQITNLFGPQEPFQEWEEKNGKNDERKRAESERVADVFRSEVKTI